MNFMRFAQERNRMCNTYKNTCKCCPIAETTTAICGSWCLRHPEEAAAVVERWAEEHPVKTRQSEFLKMFPNAMIYKESIDFCPHKADRTYTPDEGCMNTNCLDCKKDYWLAEVEG